MLFFNLRDDIIRAIKKLHVLGSGFQVIPLQGRQLVQSVPGELNNDHTTLLQSAQVISKFCYMLFIDGTFLEDRFSEISNLAEKVHVELFSLRLIL